MDSGVIVTSMGIGAAIFAGLIVFWFFHTFIKRKLGSEQSAQLPNSSQKANGKDMRRHPRMKVAGPATMEIPHGSIKVRLKDISQQGSFINNKQVEQADLKDRQRITLGNTEMIYHERR